jgi:hypothetical protein
VEEKEGAGGRGEKWPKQFMHQDISWKQHLTLEKYRRLVLHLDLKGAPPPPFNLPANKCGSTHISELDSAETEAKSQTQVWVVMNLFGYLAAFPSWVVLFDSNPMAEFYWNAGNF